MAVARTCAQEWRSAPGRSSSRGRREFCVLLSSLLGGEINHEEQEGHEEFRVAILRAIKSGERGLPARGFRQLAENNFRRQAAGECRQAYYAPPQQCTRRYSFGVRRLRNFWFSLRLLRAAADKNRRRLRSWSGAPANGAAAANGARH